MLANLIIACLIIILITFVSTVIYLVSLVVNDSDDNGSHGSSLGIDTHDFSSSPVVSPNDSFQFNSNNNHNYHNHQSHSYSNNILTEVNNDGTTVDITNQQDQTNLNAGPLQPNECHCTRRQKLVALKLIQHNPTNANINLDSVDQTIKDTSITAEEYQNALINSQILDLSSKSLQSNPELNNDLMSTKVGPNESKQPVASASNKDSDNRWWLSMDGLKERIISKFSPQIWQQTLDDFDQKDVQLGGSALHWCKTKRTMDRLIKLNLPIELRNKRGETAVHVAIKRHKLQMLTGLLCNRANIEARNDLGETPFMLACKLNNIFAAQLLLVFDADYHTVDNFNLTARHYVANTCERHKETQQQQQQQQAPSAAHLILAMLHAIGAKRCQQNTETKLSVIETATTTTSETDEKNKLTIASKDKIQTNQTPRQVSVRACADGCSSTGQYNGNSYNRWTDYSTESLYKRHMFNDIVEERIKQSKLSRVWNWNSLRANQSNNKSRLLSIDGGGLRGVIVCQIMIEMEKHLKRPVIDYFDWIGGTSVGAFIACALCQGMSLFDLRRVCFVTKDEVFNGQRPYNSKFLERVLKRTFGRRNRLSDIKDKKLALTTTLADRDPCQLKLFRNYKSPTQVLESEGYPSEMFNFMSAHSILKSDSKTTAKNTAGSSSISTSATTTTTTTKPAAVNANLTAKLVSNNSELNQHSNSCLVEDEDDKNSTKDESETSNPILDIDDPDPLVWQVVRASAAAPFFFKPYGPFLDGGIISNNPTLDLLHEFESYQKVRQFLRKKQKNFAQDESPSKLDIVVSLGTGRGRVIGRQAIVDFGQVASGLATVFSPVELVRSIRAARDLFKKLIHQSCHTEDHVLDRAQAWCSSLSVPYFRVNPPLATIFSIDDKRDEQLINALWQTKLYMQAMQPQLKELATLMDKIS